MVDTENIHKISQMGTGGSLAVITDEADFPHTGLIKALNQMSSGNIVVKTGADFDINQTGGNIIVDAGKILRNGMYHSVNTKTFADTDLSTLDKGYHLLVVADGREVGETVNNLYLRTPTAPNVVADFKLGDTIVAMIEYSSATSAGSRLIQFFTTNKEENGLSIAYASSNVYTEVGSITGDADSIDIVSTITNADINITPNGNGKIVLDGLNWPIADGAANTLLKTDGGAGLSFIAGGTGITIGSDIAVDVSDFMSNGVNNYILTATGADAFQGETGLQYDNSDLKVVGGLQVGPALQFTITEHNSGDIYLSNTGNDKTIEIAVKNGGGASKRAVFTADTHSDEVILLGVEEIIIVSLSDESTDLATGTGKASFHMPYAMTLSKVKASVNTAPVGATIIVDINENGTTILSTKLSIDASENTSETAASAAVISDTNLADNSLITFDIDQVGGSTKGKGLKVTLYGKRV
jgi:hypothetical protein